MNPSVEDYHSDASEHRTIRGYNLQANVSVKRKPAGGLETEHASVEETPSSNIDLRSDSGYSSYGTAAIAKHPPSITEVKRPNKRHASRPRLGTTVRNHFLDQIDHYTSETDSSEGDEEIEVDGKHIRGFKRTESQRQPFLSATKTASASERLQGRRSRDNQGYDYALERRRPRKLTTARSLSPLLKTTDDHADIDGAIRNSPVSSTQTDGSNIYTPPIIKRARQQRLEAEEQRKADMERRGSKERRLGGFRALSRPTRPLDDHSRPATGPETSIVVRCDVEGCDAVYLGVNLGAELVEHKRQAHQGSYSQYICEDDECDRFFRSLDARLAHYKSDHPNLAQGLSSKLRKLSTSILGTVTQRIRSTVPEDDNTPTSNIPEKVNKVEADRLVASSLLSPVHHEPPLSQPTHVKGILRKPTEHFPEHPQNMREGVTLRNDFTKGKDIPVGARWTRIDRRLVNPEALEGAKERFEERMDCVYVLRVLSKEEIQNLANRTKEIREERERQYDAREQLGATWGTTTRYGSTDISSAQTVQDAFDPKPAIDVSCTAMSAVEDGVDIARASSGDGEAEVFPSIAEDDDDTMSIASSYATSVASIFSLDSLASSASELSRVSGYSAMQIATATKVLVSIFHEDEVLTPLYQNALGNPAIGAEKLERNLRRLFKAYAKHLDDEATDRLEYHAARLMSMKARWLAGSIVERFQTRAEEYFRIGGDESSDEEADTRPVEEEDFEDLVVFREFLIGSEAFRVLRTQVSSFVLPKCPADSRAERFQDSERYGHEDQKKDSKARSTTHIEPASRTWHNWRRDVANVADVYFRNPQWLPAATVPLHLLLDAMFLATDELLTATGQLEPPIQPDQVRLRWSCQCGEALFSDVTELREGGIADLVSHMQRSAGVKVSATAYSQHSANQQYVVPRPGRWIRNGFEKIAAAFRNSTSKSHPSLPQHSNSCASSTSTSSQTTLSQPPMLHLLACMHHNRLRKFLQQDRIETIKTDRALLDFMREQYIRHRGRLLNLLSLKTVQGIFFVKFRLPIGGSVDVRHHDPCCIAPGTAAQSACECIPPKIKVEPSPSAEYRCIPGPPTTYPPVPPQYLKSLFTCPTDVHEQDTWILDQLPKRICGELQGRAGQPADGWGIYYQEGWDFDVIILYVFLIFLLASLLFGVLWSKFQFDIQGAFGVSAYMVTASGILVALLASRIEKR